MFVGVVKSASHCAYSTVVLDINHFVIYASAFKPNSPILLLVYIILLLLQICYTQKEKLHYSVFETDLWLPKNNLIPQGLCVCTLPNTNVVCN